MIKNILFDLDGTLIDTNQLIIYALKETSKKFLDRDLSEDDLNAILGKILVEQMNYLSEHNQQEMIEYYRGIYSEKHDEMIKEFPGIRVMLDDLVNLDCKTAIVSSKGRNGIERALKHFQFHNHFSVVVSSYDVINSKPHPESALKAMQHLDALPQETIIVGDSPYDIICGSNAGIKTALVDWTIFPKKSFIDLKPDFYIKTPSDILELTG